MLDAFAGVELDEAKFLELLKKVRLYVDARTCGAVPVYLWQFNLVSLLRAPPHVTVTKGKENILDAAIRTHSSAASSPSVYSNSSGPAAPFNQAHKLKRHAK